MKKVKSALMITVSCILWWFLSNTDGALKVFRAEFSEYGDSGVKMLGAQFLFIVLMILFVFSVSAVIKLQIEIFSEKK